MRRKLRSDARIARCAPIRAPGITPIDNAIAYHQSMSPRKAWVIVPGIARIPTHASDVPTASLTENPIHSANAAP